MEYITFKGRIMRTEYKSCREIVNFISDHCFSCHNRQTRQLWRKLTCCTWAETSCHRQTQFFVWIHFLWVCFTLGLWMPAPGTAWLSHSEQQGNRLPFQVADHLENRVTSRWGKPKQASGRKAWSFLWQSWRLNKLSSGSSQPLTFIKKVRRKP